MVLYVLVHAVLPEDLTCSQQVSGMGQCADALACCCSLEALTALMNEGVERLCDTLARIGKQGTDTNIWRQFGAPLANEATPVACSCVQTLPHFSLCCTVRS